MTKQQTPNTKASCSRNDPAWKHKLNEIPVSETSIKAWRRNFNLWRKRWVFGFFKKWDKA
jgi:hypothetical protein